MSHLIICLRWPCIFAERDVHKLHIFHTFSLDPFFKHECKADADNARQWNTVFPPNLYISSSSAFFSEVAPVNLSQNVFFCSHLCTSYANAIKCILVRRPLLHSDVAGFGSGLDRRGGGLDRGSSKKLLSASCEQQKVSRTTSGSILKSEVGFFCTADFFVLLRTAYGLTSC
jgi:hypothetical protein